MFVGRKDELKRLEDAYDTGTFQMAVIYGRRRVGKTTLVSEFARGKRALFFTALEQADADNLADFTRVLAEFFGLPGGVRFDGWRDAFDYLCERAEQERFVFVFDEFPYAAKRNGALPSLLQVCIDHRLQATGTFLILCGSNQGFMESDVLGRKSPLYGRRTMQMRLGPLGYRDAADMVPWATPNEAFRIYGCVGGVPYYLAQIREGRSLRENLCELYFDPAGFLYGEPGMLLRQELSEPAAYNSVLRAVAGGATRPKEIAERTKIERNSLAGYLTTLVSLGILERVVPFGENPERSKRGIYRIREAAFAFWYRFVMPRVTQIEDGAGTLALAAISDGDLDSYLGLRFERVCREWLLAQAIEGRLPLRVDAFGSWWGTDPDRRSTTDIDVVAADTRSKGLLVGECKYREEFDETEAMRELERRADLVRGYEPKSFYLFSKHVLSGGTIEKVKGMPEWHLVTVEDLYR